MKKFKFFSFLLVLVMISVAVVPAHAQLGGTQKSSFAIQNITSETANVQVTFINENGTEFTPTTLRPATSTTPELKNPFDLAGNSSIEIYVPSIPTALLPAGRYAVVISSTKQIVSTVNVLGEGAINFNGTYYGEGSGAATFYLPSFVYNNYGWSSAVTVQNVGESTTNVTLTAKCANGTTVTYVKNSLAKHASVTFDTKVQLPTTGTFAPNTRYDCSAVVTSTASNIVAVDNQTVPTAGYTQSYNGVSTSANTLYAPVLFTHYYNWDSSLNIQKIGAGTAAVTVTYSDGATPSTCNLSDATPSCSLYMPTVHPLRSGQVRASFAATITSAGAPIVAVVNAGTAGTGQAQTYNAVSAGSGTVLAPGLFKNYYGWITSVTCQNVSNTATAIRVEYGGYAGNAYNTKTLNKNESAEILVFQESFLPASRFVGAATLKATAAGGSIACIINHNNSTQMGNTRGDWSTSVNAISQ